MFLNPSIRHFDHGNGTPEGKTRFRLLGRRVIGLFQEGSKSPSDTILADEKFLACGKRSVEILSGSFPLPDVLAATIDMVHLRRDQRARGLRSLCDAEISLLVVRLHVKQGINKAGVMYMKIQNREEECS